MRQSLRIKVFFTIILFLTGLGCVSAQSTSRINFASETGVTQIPFENDFGLIFVKVQVNDSKPLWFLLDTGFDANILNAKWAKPLNIELSDKKMVPSPGGEVEMGNASGLTMTLPGLKMTDQPASSVPLSTLEPIIGRPLDGILGHDFLTQFVVEINYATRILTLRRPENYKYFGKGEIIPLTIIDKEPFLTIQVVQPGRDPIEGQFKVDTGSLDVMGLNKNFLEQRKILNEGQRSQEEPGIAVGGETKGITFRVGGLKIGSTILTKPVIGATLDSAGFENRADAGTIGAALLARFKVILDYSQSRIILEKTGDIGRPFVHDPSGLRIVAEGEGFKKFTVMRVLKDSPGARGGILEGDIITGVNGMAAVNLTLARLREILLNGAGKTYILVVSRGGKEKTVKIKLRETI